MPSKSQIPPSNLEVEASLMRLSKNWTNLSREQKLQLLATLTTAQQRELVLYLRTNREALVPQQRHSRDVLDFPEWLKEVTPTFRWDWPYLQHIYQHLNSVTIGDTKRLMLFLPPRHGKSECVTIRYPVWRLERNPELRVIIGAYNDDLATTFSRKARKIAMQRFDLSKEKASASDWETPYGGGVRSAGVGIGVTGRGAHLIVIDDPVKNREEANSPAYRQRIWDWFKDDLYTRLEPNGTIILIQTRWHQDDLAGRILASDFAEEWTVISFPALATESDVLGRQPGDALCPDRFDETALARIRRVLGNSFYALYQQTPMPPEGDFFKRTWFEVLPALPAGPWWWVRYWDFASSKDKGDYTAGVLMGLHQTHKFYVIADVQHGQWDSEERNAVIAQTAALDRITYGDVHVWREREGGASGVDAAKAFVKMLRGYPAYAEVIRGSKEVRAEPLQAQAMVGNVKLLAGAWNKPFLDELAGFPFAHDDQVDAASGAFRRLGALEQRAGKYSADEAPSAGQAQYIPAASTSFRGAL